MPGWPSVGRADEHRLTESLRRADAEAAARLYEAYADRLNDYATSLLGDQDAAAEAVHDTMITALARADRLAEPGRLRAWLYALARFHCLVRPRRPAAADPAASAATAEITGEPPAARPGAAGVDEPTAPWPVTGDGTPYRLHPVRTTVAPGRDRIAGRVTEHLPAPGLAADAPPPAADADPELAALVRQALGELDRPEREVLELAARHGLSPAETAAVVGASSRQVAARLTRARDHLENAAAAVVLARTGRAHCPDLSAMLDSWEGPLTEPLRKRLARHIAACEVCTEGRGRRVSAERLLGMIPIRYAPLSLRRRVVDARTGPEAAAARAAAALGEEHLGRDGFPIMPDRRRGVRPGRTGRARRGTPRRARARRRPRRLVTAVSALACLGLVAGVLLAAAGLDATSSGGRAALVPPASSPSAEPADPDAGADPAASRGPGDEEPGPTATAEPRDESPERTPLARPSASPRRARTTPPATRPASRPAPRPVTRRPAAARLVVDCPAALAADRTAVVRITAHGAPIAWRATTTGGLVVTPAHGRLKAGAAARLTVGADGAEAGRGGIRFEWPGGARTCRIAWAAEDEPPASEPPADEDDASPEPSPEPDGASFADGSGEPLMKDAKTPEIGD